MPTPARAADGGASSPAGSSLKGFQGAPKPLKAKKKDEVLDSWEEDELSSGDEANPGQCGRETSLPAAPAPETSQHSFAHGWGLDIEPAAGACARGAGDTPTRRPEKTDAVARRMIVAGLGLKAPKLTEEQKAYQKSVREQEKKRKEQEKADEQRRRDEAERAKAAVWDD